MAPLHSKRRQKLVANIAARLPDRRGFAKFIVLAGAGLAGAAAAFALAVSGVARLKGPDRALAFIPWEGDALTAKTDALVLSGKKLPPETIAAWSLAARRNAPLNGKAVRLLAMAAGLENKEARAEALMAKAAGLSRRDVITQVFLVEIAAKNDDLKGALAHYDTALRTSSSAPQILYPRLVKAIKDPRIRDALKPYFKSGAAWPVSFVNFAKDSADADMGALVDLLLESGGSPDPQAHREQTEALLWVLFHQRKYADLDRLLRSVPRVPANLLTQVDLASLEQRGSFGPAAWQLLDDAEAGANIVRDDNTKRTSLAIYANAGTTRPIAQKLLFLAPGRYRLSFKVVSTTPGEGRSVGWWLRCMEPVVAQPVWRLDAARGGKGSDIVIGAGCRVQLLQLLASGGGGQTGLEAEISDVVLTSAGGGKTLTSSKPETPPKALNSGE